MYPQVLERRRYVVAASLDIGNLKAGSDLYVGPGSLVGRRAIEVIRPQARISNLDIPLFVVVTVVVRHCRKTVGLFRQMRRRDVEGHDLLLPVLREGEGRGYRVRLPSV